VEGEGGWGEALRVGGEGCVMVGGECRGCESVGDEWCVRVREVSDVWVGGVLGGEVSGV